MFSPLFIPDDETPGGGLQEKLRVLPRKNSDYMMAEEESEGPKIPPVTLPLPPADSKPSRESADSVFNLVREPQSWSSFLERVRFVLEGRMRAPTKEHVVEGQSTFRCIVTITDYEDDDRLDEVTEHESYRSVSRHRIFANAVARAKDRFMEQIEMMFGDLYNPEDCDEDGPEHLLSVKQHGSFLEINYNGDVGANEALTPSLRVVVEEEEPLED